MAKPSKSLKKDRQKSCIAPGFKKQVKIFMDEHCDVLRELAKR